MSFFFEEFWFWCRFFWKCSSLPLLSRRRVTVTWGACDLTQTHTYNPHRRESILEKLNVSMIASGWTLHWTCGSNLCVYSVHIWLKKEIISRYFIIYSACDALSYNLLAEVQNAQCCSHPKWAHHTMSHDGGLTVLSVAQDIRSTSATVTCCVLSTNRIDMLQSWSCSSDSYKKLYVIAISHKKNDQL